MAMGGMNGSGNPRLDDWPDPSTEEVLATARKVVASGVSVIPISNDGSKRPDGRVLPREQDPKDNEWKATWKPFQRRKAVDDELNEWFGGPVRRGLAYVCGEVSLNLEVIDCDDALLCPEYLDLIKAHDPELYARLVIIETPSGGKHLLFRCEKIEGNQKLAMRAVEVPEGTRGARKDGDRWIKLEVLFETRGQGGYIVAPGSPLDVHPDRKPYRFKQGSVETIPTITPAERELLLDLARALNEYHPKEEKREKREYKQASQNDGDESLPGKDYDQRGDSLQDLLDAEWTIERRRGSVIYLKKPGSKDRGHHATLHAVAHNVFYCFSTAAAPFDAERKYTPFQVRALLKHNGDFKAAARELAAQGYGQAKKTDTDTAKSNGNKKTKSAPEAAALMDDAILLLLNQFPEHFTEENKMTMIALFAVFGGRKIAAVSHSLLASRIKQREGGDKGKSKDAQFGRRRLTNLRKALRRSINYPVLKMTLHSHSQPKTKNGNNRPSRYQLDMKPFWEVLGVAETIYKEWCCGAPRLTEWINPETGEPYPPNQGYCRELAALLIAGRYRKDAKVVEREEANLKPGKKDWASRETEAKHAVIKGIKKLADVWDEKNFCLEDRLAYGEELFGYSRQILQHKSKQERDRILRQLLGLKPRKRKIHPIIDDTVNFEIDSGVVESVGSKQSDSFIVATQIIDFDLQLSKWQALGPISESLPRPIIWHNKDEDRPATAIGIFADPGPDGRLYVKTQESVGGLPFDELEFLPVAATTGDPLVDALLADEMETLAEWKQPRL